MNMPLNANDARKQVDAVVREKHKVMNKQAEISLERFRKHQSFVAEHADEIMRRVFDEALKHIEVQIDTQARLGKNSIIFSKTKYPFHDDTVNFLFNEYPLLTHDDINDIRFYLREGCHCKECIPCLVYGPTHNYLLGLSFPRRFGNEQQHPFWSQIAATFTSRGFRIRYETLWEGSDAGCGNGASKNKVITLSW
jgi:hypothetical protein